MQVAFVFPLTKQPYSHFLLLSFSNSFLRNIYLTAMDPYSQSSMSANFFPYPMSEKLTHDNNMTGKRQIAHFIRSRALCRHFYGSTPASPQTVQQETKGEDDADENAAEI